MSKFHVICAPCCETAEQDLRRYPARATWVISNVNVAPKGFFEDGLASGVFSDVRGGALTGQCVESYPGAYRTGMRTWSIQRPVFFFFGGGGGGDFCQTIPPNLTGGFIN